MINASSLSLMKRTAIIVNVARGKVVNTRDVMDALDAGRLGGYAADVYENEVRAAG